MKFFEMREAFFETRTLSTTVAHVVNDFIRVNHIPSDRPFGILPVIVDDHAGFDLLFTNPLAFGIDLWLELVSCTASVFKLAQLTVEPAGITVCIFSHRSIAPSVWLWVDAFLAGVYATFEHVVATPKAVSLVLHRRAFGVTEVVVDVVGFANPLQAVEPFRVPVEIGDMEVRAEPVRLARSNLRSAAVALCAIVDVAVRIDQGAWTTWIHDLWHISICEIIHSALNGDFGTNS